MNAAVDASYAYDLLVLMPRAPRSDPPSLIGTHNADPGSYVSSGLGSRMMVRRGAAEADFIATQREVGAASASTFRRRILSGCSASSAAMWRTSTGSSWLRVACSAVTTLASSRVDATARAILFKASRRRAWLRVSSLRYALVSRTPRRRCTSSRKAVSVGGTRRLRYPW